MVSLSKSLETQLLVQEFLFAEAEILDQRRLREWLDLLTDDVTYRIPARHTLSGKSVDGEFTDQAREIMFMDEIKETLAARVAKLSEPTSWAETPPSRTRRLITNVRVKSDDGDSVEVSSYFYVYKSRLEHVEDVYIGERRDTLRRVGDSFKIAARTVYLDQTVLMVKNISIFL